MYFSEIEDNCACEQSVLAPYFQTFLRNMLVNVVKVVKNLLKK